jgi:leucyl-tRNA synthetase
VETVVVLLAPIVPHIAEELWFELGNSGGITYVPVPVADAEALIEDTVLVVVQVNGKVRERLQVSLGMAKDEVEKLALASAKVQKHIAGKPLRKVIVVPNKLVNIVV